MHLRCWTRWSCQRFRPPLRLPCIRWLASTADESPKVPENNPENKKKPDSAQTPSVDIRIQVARHMQMKKDWSGKEKEWQTSRQKDRELSARDWKAKAGEAGRSEKAARSESVPYRFRLREEPEGPDRSKRSMESEKKAQAERDQKANQEKPKVEAVYSDYAGLRFPSLDTAENYDYNRDRGFDRIVERAFPIKVPGYRRLDPYFREYIWFLNNLDPARFTISRIAKRYRLREKTVAKVVKEWATNQYLTRSGLTRLRERQQTREAVVLAKKEEAYAKWVGWDQMGDQDDPESDDEALGESKGWRSTSDWVRRQTVEVEMMSAFPMMEKRDPMPKRVDVDMVVDSRRGHKIINWIDPTDKVVF